MQTIFSWFEDVFLAQCVRVRTFDIHLLERGRFKRHVGVHGHDTCHKLNFFLTLTSLSIMRRSPDVTGARLFNPGQFCIDHFKNKTTNTERAYRTLFC